MYSTPIDLSFSYLRSVVEASLNIKKDQVDPNNKSHTQVGSLSAKNVSEKFSRLGTF